MKKKKLKKLLDQVHQEVKALREDFAFALNETSKAVVKMLDGIEKQLVHASADVNAAPFDKLDPDKRTMAQVEAQRKLYGCCSRYCDNMSCECLEKAARYEEMLNLQERDER